MVPRSAGHRALEQRVKETPLHIIIAGSHEEIMKDSVIFLKEIFIIKWYNVM